MVSSHGSGPRVVAPTVCTQAPSRMRCALEEDQKKLVEAKEGGQPEIESQRSRIEANARGCGGPRTGYSLYAGSGQTLSSPGVEARDQHSAKCPV